MRRIQLQLPIELFPNHSVVIGQRITVDHRNGIVRSAKMATEATVQLVIEL